MSTVPATPEEREPEQVSLNMQAGHWIAVVVAVLGFFAPVLFVTSWVPMVRAVIAIAVLAGLVSGILLLIGTVIV
jgi:nitrate reductase gamma subunit